MVILNFIKDCKDANKLYDGIREILKDLDARGRYPEDWEIKLIQRVADAKYSKLTNGGKTK